MKSTMIRLTPLFAAGAAAVAILAAPVASADTDQSCTGVGGATVCQSPGNVQLNADPSPVQADPYGDEPILLGGFGGGDFGGFHGGGGFGGGGGFHGGHR